MSGRGGKTSTSWKPGQSGNPAGKSRKLPDLRAKIEEEGLDAAYSAVMSVLKDEKATNGEKLAASRQMFDWGLPKPTQTVSNAELEKLEMLCAALFDDSDDEPEEGDDEAGQRHSPA